MGDLIIFIGLLAAVGAVRDIACGYLTELLRQRRGR